MHRGRKGVALVCESAFKISQFSMRSTTAAQNVLSM